MRFSSCHVVLTALNKFGFVFVLCAADQIIFTLSEYMKIIDT